MAENNWWSNPGFKDVIQTVKAKVDTNQKAQTDAGSWLKTLISKFKMPNVFEKQVNLAQRSTYRAPAYLLQQRQAEEQRQQAMERFPSIAYDPTLKQGDRVYLGENNIVTNKPTSLELFKYGDFPVVAYKDAEGMLHLPQAYRELLDVRETELEPVTYTPDLPFWLEPDKKTYDDQIPATLDPTLKPDGEQGYYDPSNNQIVNHQTALPLYWDAANPGSLTTFASSKTPNGMVKPNNPFLLEEDIVSTLAEELMIAVNKDKAKMIADPTNPQVLNPYLTAPVPETIDRNSLITTLGVPQYAR
ncbi:hypothetical protein IH575_00545, partial [Candidatus Dojkabacteria bacterium]|nr:hypothetical protein [Candidatus Dojkabacteria bacterium]